MPESVITTNAKRKIRGAPRPQILETATYAVPEAAHALGVSRATVWREIHRGRLSFYRVGTRVLVGGKHLLNYLATREERAA